MPFPTDPIRAAEARENMRAAAYRRWADPAERERNSRLALELWSDPGYAERCIQGKRAQVERDHGKRERAKQERMQAKHSKRARLKQIRARAMILLRHESTAPETTR